MRKLLREKTLRPLSVACVVLLALTLPPVAWSQSCSLCYTQAASSGARLIQALRSGIVILIFPPISICVAAMVLAYRRRNHFHQPDRQAESDSEW